jgi:hypothetical protein
MRFVAIVYMEVSGWPSPERATGKRIEIEVAGDTRLEEVAERCVGIAGSSLQIPGRYYYMYFLRNSQAAESEYVEMPRAFVAEDGQLLWTEGAKDRITIADALRTRDAGFLDADPLGMWLEPPTYGDGIIPDWLAFFDWLGAIVGTAQFLAFLKATYKRWQDRGARTPYAFLDLVLARDEWSRRDLRQLLGLNDTEASELLHSLGFECAGEDENRWTVSTDPNRSALRNRILREQLHRPSEDGSEQGEDQEDDEG